MNLIDSTTLIGAPKIRNMVSLSSSNQDNPSYAKPKRVAVIGAGVSGLAAAYKLKSQGFDVTVFESEGKVGGKLRSVSHNGLIWDEGANTMTESEIEVQTLLDDLGLREKQQFPISQNKRYIVRNGLPVMIPTNPIALIKSNILSSQSKFQLLLEPFLWKKKSSNSKISDEHTRESVRGFFQRHFGKEVVDYLIDPFVAGTSGGDPDSLSMQHSFPELWNLENRSNRTLRFFIARIKKKELTLQMNQLFYHLRFGSIIAGAIQSKFLTKKEKREHSKNSLDKKKPSKGSFSFQGGMQTLPETLSKELDKEKLRLNSRILSLAYGHDEGLGIGKWEVSLVNPDNHSQDLSVDAVIMTAPICNVKEMKITKRGTLFPLNFLPEVTYLPLSVIITAFKKDNVKRPLEGFGVLVPSAEQKHGLKTLGTLFSSMMFPDRAPNDQYLYTTFVGGSRNKELASASTDELKQAVTSDLRQLLGVEGEPTFVNHLYWKKAFPLYGHDYESVMSAIETMERNLPGFFYAGNHKGGLSVGKAIASGCKAAQLAISYLDDSS